MATALDIDGKIQIPAADLWWTAARASGPGGQNVNKVSSKVELRFDFGNTRALDDDTKARLASIAGSRIDSKGLLHVVAQDTRDQKHNLELARERLAELLRMALHVPRARKATKPSRGAKERRLRDKHGRAEVKRGRSFSGDAQ